MSDALELAPAVVEIITEVTGSVAVGEITAAELTVRLGRPVAVGETFSIQELHEIQQKPFPPVEHAYQD